MTIYRRLFEVRILHGYQLDFRPLRPGVAPNWYHLQNADNQKDLRENGYDIGADLDIVPDAATERLMKRLRMRWRTSGEGFFVGIEVVEDAANNGFKPMIAIPPDATWVFWLRPRSPFWTNFTNHAMRATLPAKYHFSNRPEAGETRVFPALSRHAPAFATTREWEMGELARHGANLKIAKKGTAAAADFDPLPGNADFRWANANDRRVLPKAFDFRFNNLQKPTTELKATLKKTDGTTLKTLAKTFAAPSDVPEKWPFDFRYLDQFTPTGFQIPIADGWYDLEIAFDGNAAPVESRRVWLRDDMPSDDSVFGLVEITNLAGAATDFHLLDGPVLRLENDPDKPGRKWPNPKAIFEIRLLSRPTYWRYCLPKAQAANGTDVVKLTDFKMESKKPLHLTQGVQEVQFSASTKLPNPTNLNLQFDRAKGIFISEIFIPNL